MIRFRILWNVKWKLVVLLKLMHVRALLILRDIWWWSFILLWAGDSNHNCRQPKSPITQPLAQFWVQSWQLMRNARSQNFMKIGQVVQELSPKNLFLDVGLSLVALMAYLAGIWLNLLLLVVATLSIWNFDHRITRKKVKGVSKI